MQTGPAILWNWLSIDQRALVDHLLAALQARECDRTMRPVSRGAETLIVLLVDRADATLSAAEVRTDLPDAYLLIGTIGDSCSLAELLESAGGVGRAMGVAVDPAAPDAVMTVVRSLQARQRAELELRARSHELEATLRVRTQELEMIRQRGRVRMDELEVLVQQRTAELRRAAMHDSLTGLPNRATFHDRLQHAISRRARNPGEPFSVLFIDFDRFKVINDSLGHEFGDKLLIAIAERLRATLRECQRLSGEELTTTAARLGGDEFCVLLEGIRHEDDAVAVANRLLDAFAKPHVLAGRSVVSTASIGIAHSSVGYSSAESVLRDADNAMYRAKQSGKARFAIFDPTMHEQAMRRLIFENDIHAALARSEMRLVYQPIVSLTSGDLVGAEALLRWHHPERGIISPIDFIPLAEETGAILPLGEWVLRQGMRQLRAWGQQTQHRPPTLSVNVSRCQLVEPGFADRIADLLAETVVDPAMLTLELTESTLTRDPAQARRMIDAIRGLGVRVVLDDFGSGYSSLGSLQDFPLDGLKLDRSFLQQQSDSARRTAACIHSVITLARDLEMDLVAEGVESLEQVALLQALGCERAQGYLFGRPVEVGQLPSFFSGSHRLGEAA
ncbi:MAG TPA: EAL domain-containing protein [Tepidisphaeraceae bacterium]|nr:EAL domain-containing protein [Tepidisphaeraceae bacterium]